VVRVGDQHKEKQRRQRRAGQQKKRPDFAAMDAARFEAVAAGETAAGGHAQRSNADAGAGADADSDKATITTAVAGDGTRGDGGGDARGGAREWDPTELALEFESLLAIFGPTRLRRLDADALYVPGLTGSRRASIAEVWELVIEATSPNSDGGGSGDSSAAAAVRIGLPVGYPARRVYIDVTQAGDSGRGAAARRAVLQAAVDAAAIESASHAEVCVYELVELVKAYIAPVTTTTTAIGGKDNGDDANDADSTAEDRDQHVGEAQRTLQKSGGKARARHCYQNHNRLEATGLGDAPGEILSTVFASLRFPDHLLAAATVCWHWRRAAEADRRWKGSLERFVANTIGYSAYTPRLAWHLYFCATLQL